MNPKRRPGALVFLRVELKIDVIDPDNFAAIDVDDLLIEQVALQQKQALCAIDRGPFCGGGFGADAAINCGYGRKRQDAVARSRFHDQRCHS